jgi:hypothetical protein
VRQKYIRNGKDDLIMKKLTAFVLCFVFVIGAASCSKSGGIHYGSEYSPSEEITDSDITDDDQTDIQPRKFDGDSEQNNANANVGTDVTYSSKYANMTITLPDGWEYEIKENHVDEGDDCIDEGDSFGISFYPSDVPEAVTNLRFNPNGIGICGTGVTFEKITLSNGLTAQKCTETFQDGSTWFLIIFHDVPGSYSAEFTLSSSCQEYEEQIIDILGTAILADGIISEDNAIAQAEAKCTGEHNGVKTSFDYVTGKWTIVFTLDDSPIENGSFII